jgi:hypothetical protein
VPAVSRVEGIRLQEGRGPEPRAGLIDSQSVMGADTVGRETRGYDAGEKINGRKRFIVTDTLGLLLTVVVVTAGVHRGADEQVRGTTSGRGHLRGRSDRLRAGPVPDRGGHRLPGRGAVEAAASPRGPGQDRLCDARHLARLLHLGEIVAVAVPSMEQEAVRDLVRAREDVRSDLMSARHRLSKLLLRQGIVCYGGKPWTGAHELWPRPTPFAGIRPVRVGAGLPPPTTSVGYAAR